MRKALLAAACLLSISLTGCITLKPSGSRPGTSAKVIPSMPLRVWGDNTCGAGALATVLNHYGDPASEDELIQSLKKGRNGGVVSIDLLLKARSEGFDSSLERGTAEIVRAELEKSRPVILMLKVVDLPGENKDLFHYIVLDGIDDSRGLMRMQFGDGKARWTTLDAVEKPWRGTEYATLLIEQKSPETAQYEADLKKAVDLESAGRSDEAIALYTRLLASRPDDTTVQIDLGNAQSAAGRPTDAEASFRKVLAIDSQNRDALNNLAWLLFQQSKFPEAEELARRAVARPGPDDDLVFDTLGEILAAEGNCSQAADAYSRALSAVPQSRISSRPVIRLRLGKAQVACGLTAAAHESFSTALQESPDEDTRRQLEAAEKSLVAISAGS